MKMCSWLGFCCSGEQDFEIGRLSIMTTTKLELKRDFGRWGTGFKDFWKVGDQIKVF